MPGMNPLVWVAKYPYNSNARSDSVLISETPENVFETSAR